MERTLSSNLETVESGLPVVASLFDELEEDLIRVKSDRKIAKLFVKLKFADFSRTTIERSGLPISKKSASDLFREAFGRKALPVRLIGIGVRFSGGRDRGSRQLEFDFVRASAPRTT